MKCPVCGKENNDFDFYCLTCGRKLHKDSLSPKNVKVYPHMKKTALILCFFLGVLGGHDFYLGRKNSFYLKVGLVLISLGFMLPVTFVWGMIDFIMIATNHFKNGNGVNVR